MTLPPIRPSAAIAERYEIAIAAFVTEMHADVSRAVLAEWRVTDATVLLAADDSPARVLQATMARLGDRWVRRITALAPKMARHFATAVQDRCDRTLATNLRKAGLSVRFRMTEAMRDALDAVIGDNVAQIKSVPERYLSQVESLVMQSVQQGRDVGTLSKELKNRYGVTKRRARGIALRQNNLATTAMRTARELSEGYTEGEWLHSAGGREPRPEHVAFSGKRFPLARGHDFHNGEGLVRPGEPYGCRCTWGTVVPGFD